MGGGGTGRFDGILDIIFFLRTLSDSKCSYSRRNRFTAKGEQVSVR